MAGEPILSLDYMEYGKLFLPRRATEFQILARSGYAAFDRMGVGSLAEQSLLRFPPRSSFAEAHGRISVALLRPGPGQPFAGHFVLVQIQRRNELELLSDEARKSSGAARRPFNQIRYTLIPDDDLAALIVEGREYVLTLLSDAGDRAGAGRRPEYRLADYHAEDMARGGKVEARPPLSVAFPVTLAQRGSEAHQATAIAYELLRQRESAPGAKLSLAVMAPELSDAERGRVIERKAAISQRVQYLVYPRLGVITFAFDAISEADLTLFLFDSPESADGRATGAVALAALASRAQRELPGSLSERLFNLPAGARADRRLLGLLRQEPLSLADAFTIYDVLKQRTTYSDRSVALAAVSRYLTLTEDTVESEAALAALTGGELRALLAQPGLEGRAAAAAVEFAGAAVRWQLERFAAFYLALPPAQRDAPEGRAWLARSVAASRADSLISVPAEAQSLLAESLLDLRREPARFVDPSGGPGSTVLAALLSATPPAYRATVARRLPADPALPAECADEAVRRRQPELLRWLVDTAAAQLEQRLLGTTLIAWLEAGPLPSGDAGQLVEILDRYHQLRGAPPALLGDWRGTPAHGRLKELLLAAAPAAPRLAERLFFDEIAEADIDTFKTDLDRLQRELPPERVRSECSPTFQYILLPAALRPPKAQTLPEQLTDRIFYYRMERDGQLTPGEVAEQISRLPNEAARQRLERLLAARRQWPVIHALSSNAARRWLETGGRTRAAQALLLEALGDLAEPDDAFILAYLEGGLGYEDAARFLKQGARWAVAPARDRLMPATVRFLDATRDLAGLPAPPKLSRLFIDLLAGNVAWSALDDDPRTRLKLIEQILGLIEGAPARASERLRDTLASLQKTPDALWQHLKESPNAVASAARWRELVGAARPPADATLRRYLDTAAELSAVPLNGEPVDDSLILLLAGAMGWDDMGPAGRRPAKLRQLATIAQSGVMPIASKAERQLRDYLQAGEKVDERAFSPAQRDYLRALQPAEPRGGVEPAPPPAPPDAPDDAPAQRDYLRALQPPVSAVEPDRSPAAPDNTSEQAGDAGETLPIADRPVITRRLWPKAKTAGDRTYLLMIAVFLILLAAIWLMVVIVGIR